MVLQNAGHNISEKLNDAMSNITKFEAKGTDAAAKRARKDLQDVARACKELRTAIQVERKK